MLLGWGVLGLQIWTHSLPCSHCLQLLLEQGLSRLDRLEGGWLRRLHLDNRVGTDETLERIKKAAELAFVISTATYARYSTQIWSRDAPYTTRLNGHTQLWLLVDGHYLTKPKCGCGSTKTGTSVQSDRCCGVSGSSLLEAGKLLL